MPLDSLIGAAQEQQQGAAATNAMLGGTIAGMIARQLDPNQKAYRAQLKRDRAALKANEFGPSQGEKLRQAAAMARQRAMADTGLEQQLDREAAAQGFGRSGTQDTARTALARQREEGAASDMGTIESAASQQALAEKAGAMARLKGQAMENIKSWYDLGSAVGAKVSGGLKTGGANAKTASDVLDQAAEVKQAELDAEKAATMARMQNMTDQFGRY